MSLNSRSFSHYQPTQPKAVNVLHENSNRNNNNSNRGGTASSNIIDHDLARSYVSNFINIHCRTLSAKGDSIPKSINQCKNFNNLKNSSDTLTPGGNNGFDYLVESRYKPTIYYNALVDLSPQRAYHCTGLGQACRTNLESGGGNKAENQVLLSPTNITTTHYKSDSHYPHNQNQQHTYTNSHINHEVKEQQSCGAVHYGFCLPLNCSSATDKANQLKRTSINDYSSSWGIISYPTTNAISRLPQHSVSYSYQSLGQGPPVLKDVPLSASSIGSGAGGTVLCSQAPRAITYPFLTPSSTPTNSRFMSNPAQSPLISNKNQLTSSCTSSVSNSTNSISTTFSKLRRSNSTSRSPSPSMGRESSSRSSAIIPSRALNQYGTARSKSPFAHAKEKFDNSSTVSVPSSTTRSLHRSQSWKESRTTKSPQQAPSSGPNAIATVVTKVADNQSLSKRPNLVVSSQTPTPKEGESAPSVAKDNAKTSASNATTASNSIVMTRLREGSGFTTSYPRSVLQKRAIFENVSDMAFNATYSQLPRRFNPKNPVPAAIENPKNETFPAKQHNAHQFRSKLFYENLSSTSTTTITSLPSSTTTPLASTTGFSTKPVHTPSATPKLPQSPQKSPEKTLENRDSNAPANKINVPPSSTSTSFPRSVNTNFTSSTTSTAKLKELKMPTQLNNKKAIPRFSLLESNKIFQSQPTVVKKKRGSVTDAEINAGIRKEPQQHQTALQRTLSLPRKQTAKPKEDIPKFHFPYGKPPHPLPRHLENTVKVLHEIKEIFAAIPQQRISQVDEAFVKIIKLCNFSLYWKKPILQACNDKGFVTYESYSKFWKKLVDNYHDDVAKFYHILCKPGARGLVVEDFVPMMHDIIETHPGLSFLKEVKEFHMRYVHTVISRIFFVINRSWSGVITLPELKKNQKLLEAIRTLETEEDINKITDFFSYEHFYVIYCKFWELDTDHDLLIDKKDLSRHGDFALSSRIVDRIFSGAVTRGPQRKDNRMTYQEFVWFLIAEEDKKQPTSIEYWFRCMDIDGDGILSLYELEYFYEEQSKRLESLGIESLPFKDCLCQILDVIQPQDPKKIKLSDLKNSKMTPMFFDTFFNVDKYLDFEQKDPFLLMRAEKEESSPVSDWDKYVSYEYENLVAEENYTGSYDEDDNLTSLDDDELAEASLHRIRPGPDSTKDSKLTPKTVITTKDDANIKKDTKKSATSFIDEVKMKFRK